MGHCPGGRACLALRPCQGLHSPGVLVPPWPPSSWSSLLSSALTIFEVGLVPWKPFPNLCPAVTAGFGVATGHGDTGHRGAGRD